MYNVYPVPLSYHDPQCIQKKQMHRIKQIKEPFISISLFAIIKIDTDKCREAQALPYHADIANYACPDSVRSEHIKDQYQQAYNTWQNSILKAGNEVSNALVQYNTSAEKSAIEEKQIAVLKQNVEDTRALMSSAGSTYLEVITAQTSLLNAEIAKVSDDLAKMQAVVSLYQALGGGAN